MADQWGRMIAGSAALAVLWIAVYWAWEPSAPPITYGTSPNSASGAEPGRDAGDETDRAAAQPVEPAARPNPVPPKPIEPPPEKLVPKAVAPEFTTYKVQKDDTLASISRKFFNTEKHTSAIAKANPFKDPQRLKAGDEIRIPRDPGNIQGRDALMPDSTPEETPKPAVSKTYTVKPGDTLSEISKKHYGTTKYADLIYEANRKTLSSPDDISVGESLVIPPKPDEKAAPRDGRS